MTATLACTLSMETQIACVLGDGMSIDQGSQDFDLIRGDDQDLLLVCTHRKAIPQETVRPVVLTGATLVLTIKKARPLGPGVYADPVVARKTTDDTAEILITDGAGGLATARLLSADTRFLAPGVYPYDLRLTTTEGRRATIARGKINLLGDVGSAEDQTTP